MADRKVIQLADKNGNIYDVKDTEAREDITELKSAINSIFIDHNTSSDLWQSGGWSTNSSAYIDANTRYISLKGYLTNVDTIVNHDTTKYKYGLIAHDLTAQYPNVGWYDTETGEFKRYAYYFITSEKFDVAAIQKQFPGYSLTVSVRMYTETDMNVSMYDCVSFIESSIYDKNYIDEALGEMEDALSSVVEDINGDKSKWQVGVWDNGSGASIGSGNTRYISYNGYLDDVDTIINNDTTKYKYGIVAHDPLATYPGMGYYDTTTDTFKRYDYYFITDEEFDLSALKAKFPHYKFSISVRMLTETDMNTGLYQRVSLIGYRSYDKSFIDNGIPVNKAIYVAANGSDSNSGKDSSHPVLTVNHALNLGATHVLVSGGVYEQTIDLGLCRSPYLSIKNITPTARAIFYAPDSLIATSEEKVDGYTNVYSAETDHTFTTQVSRVFQDGVPDETTEVADSDRHPLQRGAFYRCEDTKLYKCTADNLSDALTEIDGSDTYKWYYDSASETIYYSRPQTVSSTNPLRTGVYSTAFLLNESRDMSLEMTGIECKYMRLSLKMANAKIVDCRVANACGGGIMYNNGVNIELIRCEAVSAYSGGLGDGICATGSADYGKAKGTTVTMIDCWAHDNNDDGFSDHVACETTIIGGLYEYNGKGGVLPTGGGSCTCYNTESRYNAIGFEIAGTGATTPVASGRNGQQLTCFGCVAAGNSQYGYFVSSNQDMTMKMVGCKSMNNAIGYAGLYNCPSSEMIAIDCTSYGDTTAQSMTITVINTNALS